MRTTIDLPVDLLASAKERADEARSSLSAVVSEALRRFLRPATAVSPTFTLVTGGQPGGSAMSWEDIKRSEAEEDLEQLRSVAERSETYLRDTGVSTR